MSIPDAIDQGIINNCTAWCVCYGLQARYDMNFDPNWFMGMRKSLNASISANLFVAKAYGALPDCYYSIDPCPSEQAKEWANHYRSVLAQLAASYKIRDYQRIDAIDGLCTAISAGLPVAFSVSLSKEQPDSDGVFRPYSGTGRYGVHAMSAWRLNENGTVRVLNSRGKAWGANGQCDMMPVDIIRGGDCWAYSFMEEEMRTRIESAVPEGKRVKLREKPASTSKCVGYMRSVDEGTLLSRRGDWCEVSIAQTADESVVGWCRAEYITEVL